jgi:hypothetical protein
VPVSTQASGLPHRRLPDPSTDAELIERGRDLAAAMPEHSAAEARYRTLRKALGAEIGRANNLPADQDDWGNPTLAASV